MKNSNFTNIRLFFYFSFTFLLIVQSFATDYYVSTTGDDNNDGSIETPWKTFKNAISNTIQPGDIVFIRGGVYSEYADIYAGDEAIIPLFRYSNIDGDSDNPITFKSYPGETAIIDPQGNSVGILLQGDHITGIIIENIEIRNSRRSGIKLEDEVNNIIIRNNHIYDTDGAVGNNISAIRMNGSHDILIENNLLHSNYIREAPNLNSANIFIFSNTKNITIRNNEMYDSEQGIFYKHSGYGPSVFENNYLHDLRASGFKIASDSVTMKNNILFNIEGRAFDIHSEGGCTNCTRSSIINHNTVVNCGMSYYLLQGGNRPGAINTTITNNIFYQSGNPEIWVYGSNDEFTNNTADLHASYNNFLKTNLAFDYFGNDGAGNLGDIYSLTEFQDIGHELNSFNEDPLFVNSSSNLNQIEDVELYSTSPSYESGNDGENMGAIPSLVGIIEVLELPNVTNHIHIDQVGYRPNSKKTAVISNPIVGFNAAESFSPGTTYEIREYNSENTVFSANITEWNNGNTHAQSGDKAWWFDFSSFTTEGEYYVYDPTNDVRSYKFSISNEVYNDVLKQALRTFYYQRCGTPKASPYAEGGWTDITCHHDTNQDLTCRSITDQGNAATEKDLSGGWHDAGDYNKYVNYTFGPMHQLLSAYEENPTIWGDDNNIPESGNGIPDILDEIKWELDWLLKMQLDDGSCLMKVSVTEWQSGSPPSSDNAARYYGEAQSSATRVIASILAHAAIIFEQWDNTYATTLLQKAELAWDWIESNPGYSYYNNTGFTSSNPEITEYRQDAVLTSAAAYLYAATDDTDYRTYFDNNYDSFQFLQWTSWYTWESILQDVALYYTAIPDATSSVVNAIRNNCSTSVSTNNSDFLLAFLGEVDAYRAHMNAGDYTWGSNREKFNTGSIFANMNIYDIDSNNSNNYAEAAEEYIHFAHGVNPINLAMLSNMNAHGMENSCNEIYHAWFGDGTAFDNAQTSTYGPAPGFITGGLNPNFTPDTSYNGTIDPPQNQPVQKSYKDWNTSYPENSWKVTEPAIYYQTAYIKLLSKFSFGNYPLPIENLKNLNAYIIHNDHVKLTWSTTSENNNKGFELQRSIDAINWLKIGWVKGENIDIQSYQFIDKSPILGINYYRYKQFDYSSKHQYSNVVSIEFNSKKIQLFPNPTSGILNIVSDSNEEIGNVVIYNQIGQKLMQTEVTNNTINVSSLPVGIYNLEIFVGNRISSKKLVIKEQ